MFSKQYKNTHPNKQIHFFQEKYFQAVVTVNLTGMLVLTTLFIANLNALPRTPNLKLMDVWLIFTLLIPFAEVLLHTAISSFQERSARNTAKVGPRAESGSATLGQEDEGCNNNRALRIILVAASVGMPTVFAIFCMVFFTYAALVP